MQLFDLLPDYYEGNKTMELLQSILSAETDALEDRMEEGVDQTCIVTASTLLSRWEKILDVPTRLSLTDTERREALIAKLTGIGTTTAEMIKSTAAAFSGGEVEVIEENGKSRFIVRFVGVKGIPTDIESFKNMLEEIKPAHLDYALEYTYTVWNELREILWDDISGNTWDEVKVKEV